MSEQQSTWAAMPLYMKLILVLAVVVGLGILAVANRSEDEPSPAEQRAQAECIVYVDNTLAFPERRGSDHWIDQVARCVATRLGD